MRLLMNYRALLQNKIFWLILIPALCLAGISNYYVAHFGHSLFIDLMTSFGLPIILLVWTLDRFALLAEANKAVVAKEYNRAVEICKRIIARRPHDTKAYIIAAIAYSSMNQPQNALEFCNKAIALEPKNATAYSNRGAAYAKLGHFDEALRDCDTALKLNCGTLYEWWRRALILINRSFYKARLNLVDEAMTDLNEALSLARGFLAREIYFLALSYRARVNISKGDLEAAAHKACSRHREQVLKSDICGCFYCLRTFHPKEIEQWTDTDENGVGTTAMCPRCGIDSILGSESGYPITEEFLKRMNKIWFGRI